MNFSPDDLPVRRVRRSRFATVVCGVDQNELCLPRRCLHTIPRRFAIRQPVGLHAVAKHLVLRSLGKAQRGLKVGGGEAGRDEEAEALLEGLKDSSTGHDGDLLKGKNGRHFVRIKRGLPENAQQDQVLQEHLANRSSFVAEAATILAN